ncbi:hypothetical protein RMATCC62417_03905 [Rhizopus microsporus]|nr:hypothetical protein RMATCC62417_03905 [Rhizopus microsporus]
MSQETDDNTIIISLPTKPGSDLASKLLLQHEEIIHTIVNSLTDGNINGSMYKATTNEYPDSRKSDVVYIPHSCKITEATSPIAVEIQQIIDWSFMRRLMRYCLSICDAHKVMPKVLIFAIKGFSSKAFLNEFTLERGYYTINSKMWAQTIRIYSLDSIADLVDYQETLKPIVALVYFLCSQEKSIISLDLCDDAEIRKLYVVANEIFSDYIVNEETVDDFALDIINKTSSQFSKIISCAESSNQSSLKKIIAYAKNGVEYTSKKRKLFVGDTELSPPVTPVEVEDSADLHFVKQYLASLNGQKANWKKCYEEGKEQSLFVRFTSFLSLKGAYHKNRL